MLLQLLLWWLQVQAAKTDASLPVVAHVGAAVDGVTPVRLVLQDGLPQEFLNAATQLWWNNMRVSSIATEQAFFTREVTLRVSEPVTPEVLARYESDLRAIVPQIQEFVRAPRPPTVAASVYISGRVIRFWRNPAALAYSDAEFENELTVWKADHPDVKVDVIRFYRFGTVSDILILGSDVFDASREEQIARERKAKEAQEKRKQFYLRWAI